MPSKVERQGLKRTASRARVNDKGRIAAASGDVPTNLCAAMRLGTRASLDAFPAPLLRRRALGEEDRGFNITYLLVALMAVLSIQDWVRSTPAVAVIPYSQFQKLLDDGKVAEVTVSQNESRGPPRAGTTGEGLPRAAPSSGLGKTGAAPMPRGGALRAAASRAVSINSLGASDFRVSARSPAGRSP